MKALTVITLLIVTITILSGCVRKHTPTDLPKLYPCVITVTQDGKPLEGVAVTLTNADNSAKYRTATGESGADGVAVIRCYGESGVPLGTYKISLQKTVSEKGERYKDETGMEKIRGEKFYYLVDTQYLNPETTPLEITVQNGKNERTVDTGRAMKQEFTPIM